MAEKKYSRLSCEDPKLKLSPLGGSIKRRSRKQPKGNSGPVTDSAPCPHLFGFTALQAASQVGKCIKQSHPISGQEDSQKETTMKPVMEMAGAYPAEIKASRHEPGLPLYKILLDSQLSILKRSWEENSGPLPKPKNSVTDASRECH